MIVFACALVAYPETPVEMGTRLAKQNDDRPVFEKVKNKANLVIYGPGGEVRFKKALIMGGYTENMNTINSCEKYITYFMAPADDQGNAYMSYHYKNQSDVKWAYLKGIRKAKKITGADKKLSFFGSDFSNGEMGKPNFTEWIYKYLGDDKVTFQGKTFDCYMVENLPKTNAILNENGCARRVSFLEKKTLLTLRLDYYDENGNKAKEMRLLSFTTKNNVLGQKVYYETGLEMRNVKTGTRSELHFADTKFEDDARIRTDIFTEQYLTQKWW
jgi:hypothetical protein